MIQYEDNCVGCTDIGLWCMGSACPNRNIPHYYCDNCNAEDTIYDTPNDELCIDCVYKIYGDLETFDFDIVE